MTPTQQFEENTGASFLDVTGVPPRFIDFEVSLDIPDYHRALIEGLSPLEFEAATRCHAFILSRKIKDDWLTQECARLICELMAGELAKGNFKLLRIISEGLTNLQNGRPFKGKSGRKPSKEKNLVLIAFYQLRKTGISQPSQSEVAEWLSLGGYNMKPDRLSKIFDELDLRSISSDGREAASQAGKRKRAKR